MEKIPGEKQGEKIKAIEVPMEQPGLQTPAEQPEVMHVPMPPELDVDKFIKQQEEITQRKRGERPGLDS